MPLGLYLSIPFCRSKCTFCNFASGVNSRSIFGCYVDRVCRDLENAEHFVREAGGIFDCTVDSIYFGGGTPTILEISQLERLFVTISQNFQVARDAEITVECAPGTLPEPTIDALLRFGVNRVSLGVQSFVDRESAAIARLHNRAIIVDDIARLHSAGINNINIDLIAGLPHQTAESWHISLSEALAANVPHVSVYMLEVDDDSRLGRELIAGGTKYHAHFVPDEDLTADLYELACERLNDAGIEQYEISNFARPDFESKHNLKYWTRQPYLGFGLDAHSMLAAAHTRSQAIRFATPDALGAYISREPTRIVPISQTSVIEEHLFLGLRLNRGVDLADLEARFGGYSLAPFLPAIMDLTKSDLLRQERNVIRLTPRGRLLSNEVFQRFVSPAEELGGGPALAQQTAL